MSKAFLVSSYQFCDGRRVSRLSTSLAFNFLSSCDLAFVLADNDFNDAELLKFEETTDTYLSGNTIGDACIESSSSTFASDSDDVPSC